MLTRLQDAIGRALRVIAAALVVEHRNFFGRTFTKAHTDLQFVRVFVVLVLKRLDFGQLQ